MSQRTRTATPDELAQAALLRELPEPRLAELAARMTVETVPCGEAPVVEQEPGDRFYIVLDGVFAVSHRGELGPRRVLRQGDYFGEVALAMDIPRTASVRALTDATVASSDRATFDEFVRPLFADD